jgi:hypothetical protein
MSQRCHLKGAMCGHQPSPVRRSCYDLDLIQLGRPVEVRPSTPWHWLAISLCFSYLIDDKAAAAVRLATGFG